MWVSPRCVQAHWSWESDCLRAGDSAALETPRPMQWRGLFQKQWERKQWLGRKTAVPPPPDRARGCSAVGFPGRARQPPAFLLFWGHRGRGHPCFLRVLMCRMWGKHNPHVVGSQRSGRRGGKAVLGHSRSSCAGVWRIAHFQGWGPGQLPSGTGRRLYLPPPEVSGLRFCAGVPSLPSQTRAEDWWRARTPCSGLNVTDLREGRANLGRRHPNRKLRGPAPPGSGFRGRPFCTCLVSCTEATSWLVDSVQDQAAP